MDISPDLIWQLIDQARLRPGEHFMEANRPEVRQAWADALGIPYREDKRPRPPAVFYAPYLTAAEGATIPGVRQRTPAVERQSCPHPQIQRRQLIQHVGGCKAVCLDCGGYLRW